MGRLASAPRVLAPIAILCGAAYLVLVLACISPSDRVIAEQRLGVQKDSQLVRRSPIEGIRYYADVQGDAYDYFEQGMRIVGKPLPPSDSPLAARLSKCTGPTCQSSSPLLPYRDFVAQYPPLAELYFAALAAVSGNFDVFFMLVRAASLAAVIGIASIGFQWWKALTDKPPGAYVAVATIAIAAMGPRWLCMFDALPALCAAIAVWASWRGRHGLAAAAWAAGVLFKLYPIALGPILLWRARRVRSWRGAAGFGPAAALAGGAIMLPWLLQAPQVVLGGFMVQMGRHYLEFGSVAASGLLLLTQLGLAHFTMGGELGSGVLVSTGSAIVKAVLTPLLVFVIATISVCFALGSGKNSDASRHLAYAVLLIEVMTLILAPVFSPQYTFWLLPAILPLLGDNMAILIGLVMVGICMQLQFPVLEIFSGTGFDRLSTLNLTIRDGGLLILTVAGLRGLGGLRPLSFARKAQWAVPRG